MADKKKVTIYTDGACIGNPGPGGYGVVLMYKNVRKELSAGYRNTTNNRMELTAVIKGLEALKTPCSVHIYSDSKYVVDGIEKGWARRWKSQYWRKTPRSNKIAKNVDLWNRLLELCDFHDVKFQHVEGHSGIPDNELCDRLATTASLNPALDDTPQKIPGIEPPDLFTGESLSPDVNI